MLPPIRIRCMQDHGHTVEAAHQLYGRYHVRMHAHIRTYRHVQSRMGYPNLCILTQCWSK